MTPEEHWTEGEAHRRAVAAVDERRRDISSEAADRNSAVEQRRFRSYVYAPVEGAGTHLESSLRGADARVLVGRPRAPGQLADGCLARFDGFRAGASGFDDGAPSPGAASSLSGAPTAPAAAPAGPEGLFDASTRPALSGGRGWRRG